MKNRKGPVVVVIHEGVTIERGVSTDGTEVIGLAFEYRRGPMPVTSDVVVDIPTARAMLEQLRAALAAV